MSERSSFSAGPRTNPLYGGPSGAPNGAPPGNRTPSWVKKSQSGRGSAYSDTASSPPDSPPRSGQSNFGPSSYYAPPQYEHPGYTVQTPGHDLGSASASPYRAPPYYVQTPAQSDMVRPTGESPLSSAPSSPPHSYGANGTPFDARSNRSGQSRRSARMAAPGAPIGKIDEEAEEMFPDKERDIARKRRFWKCLGGWCCVVLILCIAAGAITAWILFQPTQPTYTYDDTTVNQFYATNGYDANGLPTTQLYLNITIALSTQNSNSYYTSYLDSGTVSVGYSSVRILAQSGVPTVTTYTHGFKNFTTSVSTMAYPLYGAGPLLSKNIADRLVMLRMDAVLNSHVQMAWKLLAPSYVWNMTCFLNIDPYTLQYVNNTCSIN